MCRVPPEAPESRRWEPVDISSATTSRPEGLRRKYHRRESAVQARPTKLKVRDYKHIAPPGQGPRRSLGINCHAASPGKAEPFRTAGGEAAGANVQSQEHRLQPVEAQL